MGRRGPIPKGRAMQVLHGTAPLTGEILDELQEEFQVPDMPVHFGKEERAAWKRAIELLRPIAKLKKIDAAVLSAYCCSFVRWQRAERQMQDEDLCVETSSGPKTNPLVTICRDTQRDMVFYAAQLGMTPAARLKMAQGTAPHIIEKNPFVKIKQKK